MIDLLENLNDNQKKAVLHKDGALLVLAGAGAGKTRVIAHRVAHMVSQGIEPENILAITFTNKAAAEMKGRINSLLQSTLGSGTLGLAVGSNSLKIEARVTEPSTPRNTSNTSPFVSTFHALGVHILRKSGRPIGVPRDFSIFDKEDSLSLIKSAIKELDLDPKQFQPAKMQSVISRYKSDLITADEFANSAGNEYFPKILASIWELYEKQLQEQKALDFDDLVAKTFFLMRDDAKTREYYQNLWRYIMIDEYQDTNKSQYELSKILATKHKNICIIGDIDQSIYSWRGADFKNIINFERDYPAHTMVVLEENYRSTQTILEAAANVIEKNKMRKPKKLVAQKGKGTEISLFEAMTEREEAEFIAHKIKQLIADGEEAPEIAILYRANFQSRILEESCLKHNIPYQLLGTRFYQRKEVKDVFAFLRAAINPASLVDIKRIINVPPRGLGKVTILNYFASKKLTTEQDKKVTLFLDILKSIKEKIVNDKPSNIVRFAMQATGYQAHLESGGDDDKERLENLKELVSIAARYDNTGESGQEGVEKLLADAALASEQDSLDKKQQSIRLMTVHAAKGLEFKNVFIAGLEDGLFPHSGFGDNGPEKQEEERRLFYVAITRAEERLFLSFSVSRIVFGAKQLNMPSQFISDIPEHLMKIETHDRSEEIIEYL